MKRLTRYVLILALVTGVAGLASAQQNRKLPQGAYLKTAKIEMSYAEANFDSVRYFNAQVMLDSLFLYYGPIPEGLSLMSRIMGGFIEHASGPKAKEPWVTKYAKLADSLKWACGNNDVKSGDKKECKVMVALADSMRVKYWREFYNAGVSQIAAIDELNKQLTGAVSDSDIVKSNKEAIAADVDSALTNLKMCVVLDPPDSLAYLALGQLFQKQKDYKTANEWLLKSLAYCKDSAQTYVNVAYNFIEDNNYCDAIPYFREYLKFQPKDTATMFNVTICFSRCKMLDSCIVWYHKMLDMAPGNFDAMEGMGRYFNTLALIANDSSRHYTEAKDEATAKKWGDLRTQRFDSSYTYFKGAYKAKPTEESSAEEFAVVAAILQKFDEALPVYVELTTAHPTSTNYWTSLGDCYYSVKKFDKAAEAYEKVRAVDPTNRSVLEQLKNSYELSNQPAKKAEIEKLLQ